MSEDILHQQRIRLDNDTLDFNFEIYNKALLQIEDICIKICNKSLEELGLPIKLENSNFSENREIFREQQYDIQQLQAELIIKRNLLNDAQKYIHCSIMQRYNNGEGGIFFINASGGTGKTFLLNMLLAEVRSKNEIAIGVASSGIASTLLEGGRTAHGTFKLPINIQNEDTPVCNFKNNSPTANLLKRCKFIIWDECTMAHKKSLEALDRTLKELKGNNSPMGGILVVLAGKYNYLIINSTI